MGRKRKIGKLSELQTCFTIDEAFQRLHSESKQRNGNMSCDRFNTALREGQILLEAGGVKVEPSFFVTHLLISAERTSGGGWTAKMTATRALERPANEYEWTVSASDVDRLLAQKAKAKLGRRPGPVTTHDWIAISAEIAFRCRKAVPKNERKLADDLLQWCEDTYGKCPAESEMRNAVKEVCARFRQA